MTALGPGEIEWVSLSRRFNYYRRIFAAYLTPRKSQLTFWHEVPEINEQWVPGKLGPYPMTFAGKADYAGQYDRDGIPLLDYHGVIGLQYNPIAIAQYGLANYNLFAAAAGASRKAAFLRAADWLVDHLEGNAFNLGVWHHQFDWDYRTRLAAPWYSGLAQGQGISLLLRAHQATGEKRYLDAAARAFASFSRTADNGGVTCVDEEGFTWFEEYLVFPPTHILNGFIWAAWGVYDYFLATRDETARSLFNEAVRTLKAKLRDYDTGYWSLYEQSGTWLPMLASRFYHHLHIVQLEALYRITAEPVFLQYKERWEDYRARRRNRIRAQVGKIAFKLCYY